MGVASLPDNFPIQQKRLVVFNDELLMLFFKTMKLIVEWEVIWQANDSF